uniref:Uncharacterized protein n=2 Tax=Candidatus Kentrum sp. TC TaxID=2126339 RepID=A0A451AFV5_9GAMM|nr:MAG: hypothetical protein BECKTC1821F_GA0114240_11521 [Candidatus Kentron sp. TC]
MAQLVRPKEKTYPDCVEFLIYRKNNFYREGLSSGEKQECAELAIIQAFFVEFPEKRCNTAMPGKGLGENSA